MRYPPDSWKQKKPEEKAGDLTEENLSELLAAAEDEDDD